MHLISNLRPVLFLSFFLIGDLPSCWQKENISTQNLNIYTNNDNNEENITSPTSNNNYEIPSPLIFFKKDNVSSRIEEGCLDCPAERPSCCPEEGCCEIDKKACCVNSLGEWICCPTSSPTCCGERRCCNSGKFL